MLQQLAKHSPTIFFARVHEFFDLLWGPIWDTKEFIRFAAGRALSACLAVLKERTYHLQWYCYLYDQLLEGFHNGSEEFVHGSMLVLSEALTYTGDFMIPRFKEVCRVILQPKLKDHKSRVVRSCIITLLPSLAQLCPDAFTRAHLDEAVELFKRFVKAAELRPQVLLATGKLCLAVGRHLAPRMDDLVTIIREAFGPNLQTAIIHASNTSALSPAIYPAGKLLQLNARSSTAAGSAGLSSTGVSAEALMCISDMVKGLGSPFHGLVLNVLLEPMLQSGLTEVGDVKQ